MLPPGQVDVVDRLRLPGELRSLVGASSRDPTVQAKLGEMSARASGDPGDPPERVATEFEGRFKLGRRHAVADGVEVPDSGGAAVQLAGTYGLRTEALAFDGTLRMQATISEAAGGGGASRCS